MTHKTQSFILRVIKNENGQILPWMAMLVVLFLGMAGLSLDLGHAYVCYRELQASTDAAALAGGYAMSLSTATTTTVGNAVTAASSMTGGVNANINLPSANATPTLECLTTVTNMGINCSASPTAKNAIQVVQTAVVPTYFIRGLAAFGVTGATSITLSATSTAAMRGATNSPYNVAIIIDTTNSMGSSDTDASCLNTRIHCALQGVQTLLKSLSPCTAASESGTCVGFDTVSLFTFPNIQANQASKDTTCPSSNPAIPYYYTPARGATWSAPTGTSATYQVTGYLDDFSSTNAAGGSLSTSSALTVASGGGTCNGLQTPGGDGTYYAAAIYAAQSSLALASSNRTGSQNALIILSDGDASSGNITVTGTVQAAGTGTPKFTVAYPSTTDQCQQAIDAANYATAQGTTVYTIAYGASSSGCSTDTSGPLKGLSPCTALQDMASSPADFYSDATASQNKGQCTSASNPNLTLGQIFQNVATSFTVSRLIPNGAS
jgi:hypothetical protein